MGATHKSAYSNQTNINPEQDNVVALLQHLLKKAGVLI